MNWNFPSRAYGESEGFSNAAIADFKGTPLYSLAREICQNSLDAADGSGRPVIVEFQRISRARDYFPGIKGLETVLESCAEFWQKDGDAKTRNFLSKAKEYIKRDQVSVLRISDHNTTGVSGAFSDKIITPWGSLVKGNAFSV